MSQDINCDLMVIGAGIAGMAAAAFATARGISVVQAGLATTTMFASGCFDLLGVSPEYPGRSCEKPFEAIDALRNVNSAHPYARLQNDEIRTAFDEFLSFCRESGLEMHCRPEVNMHFATPVGTVKTTYAVPASLLHGVHALSSQTPCLLADVKGLKGYSARQVAFMLDGQLPVTDVVRLSFPGFEDKADVYVRQMALAMENPRIRNEFVARLLPHVGEAQAVGLPAMLGLSRCREVLRAVQDGLGVPVFEIPTMPPGVAGERMKLALDEGLRMRGVRILNRRNVLDVQVLEDGFRLEVGSEWPEYVVQSKAVLLASGRFLGKGLVAKRTGVEELLFNIPVSQPESRDKWHEDAFFAEGGHAINRAGIVSDNDFRPMDRQGKPVHENLFAAGAILANQDWMREKSGTGIAVCSAYHAVCTLVRNLEFKQSGE